MLYRVGGYATHSSMLVVGRIPVTANPVTYGRIIKGRSNTPVDICNRYVPSVTGIPVTGILAIAFRGQIFPEC
jgi:hypothetical protein